MDKTVISTTKLASGLPKYQTAYLLLRLSLFLHLRLGFVASVWVSLVVVSYSETVVGFLSRGSGEGSR